MKAREDDQSLIRWNAVFIIATIAIKAENNSFNKSSYTDNTSSQKSNQKSYIFVPRSCKLNITFHFHPYFQPRFPTCNDACLQPAPASNVGPQINKSFQIVSDIIGSLLNVFEIPGRKFPIKQRDASSQTRRQTEQTWRIFLKRSQLSNRRF